MRIHTYGVLVLYGHRARSHEHISNKPFLTRKSNNPKVTCMCLDRDWWLHL